LGLLTPVKPLALRGRHDFQCINGICYRKIRQKVESGWDQDAPGKAIGFPGSLLKHLNNSISRNPYLVIKVDKRIIPDHGNFYDLRVTEFLRYLISLSIPPKKTNDANNKAESNDQ
jgi:hypothetical protein